MPDVDMAPCEALCARFRAGSAFTAAPMPGGASTRRYFRVLFEDGASAVAMFVPEGAKPEEIQKHHHGARWPFLEVHELLAERGIRVPRILGEDTDRGWLLIEDLGDDTLANYLLRRPEEKPALYTQAVTDLAVAQGALAELPEGSVVATRSFDYDLLFWEIEHFREWGVEGRGRALSPEDRATFDAIAQRVAKRIAALPRGFVHRDYQSRNLMVKDGRLVWIDFQDALLGPRVYDLVALLNDSYQEFDRAFVSSRLDEYAARAGLDAAAREQLGLEFDLVTVQRKLKDAGRFVFIDKKKNNPSFLRFVTPTIRKVKDAVSRLKGADEDMRTLEGVLARTLGDEYA
jgi:hypothetical protein